MMNTMSPFQGFGRSGDSLSVRLARAEGALTKYCLPKADDGTLRLHKSKIQALTQLAEAWQRQGKDRDKARLNMAWHGIAWHCMARQGTRGQGKAKVKEKVKGQGKGRGTD